MSIELEIRSNSRQAQQDLGQLNKQLGQIQDNTARQADSFRNLGRAAQIAAAGIGTLFAGNALTRSGDTLRRINTQLKLVTDSTEAFAKAQNDLNRIAISTRKDTEQLATVYNRLSRSAKSLGKSQDDIAKATKAIAQSIEISGASAESANAAIIQLGQGLSAGQLRGEELNSVLEQAPRLAQAIADELKITTGELRNVAKEGKLTSDVVFTALLNQAQKINSEFAQVDLTVSSAGQVFSTGATNFLAAIDKSLGLSEALANNLQAAGIALNDASKGVGDLGAVASARFALLRTDVEQMVASLTDVNFNFSAEGARRTLNELADSIEHIAANNELFDKEDIALVKREIEIIGIMIRGMIRDAQIEFGFDHQRADLEVLIHVIDQLEKDAAKISLEKLGVQAKELKQNIEGLDLSVIDGFAINTQDVTDQVIEGLNNIKPEDAKQLGEVLGTGLSLGLPKTFTLATNSQFFSDFAEGIQSVFAELNVQTLVDNIGAGLSGVVQGVTNAVPSFGAVGDFFESPIFNSIDASLEGIHGVVSTAFGGLSTGQLSGLVLALTTFTQTGQTLAAPGRAAGQALLDPVLQRTTEKALVNLDAQATALAKIAGIDTSRVKEYNAALAQQAEISTGAAAANRKLNDLRAQGRDLARGETAERTKLAAQIRQARAERSKFNSTLNATDAQVKKIEQNMRQLGVTAAEAGVKFRALDTQIKALRNIAAASEQRSVDRTEGIISGVGNVSGLVGGAVGGAIGFEIGTNFVEIIEDNLFDLPGWAEIGVTIGTSILGQLTGTAIATAIGTALGAGIVSAIGGTGVAAALTAAIGAAFAAVTLPALAIGAIVIGGVALAVYFKDELLEAWNAVGEWFEANIINPLRSAFGLATLDEMRAQDAQQAEVLAPTVEKLVPIIEELKNQRGTSNFGLGTTLARLSGLIESGGFSNERQAQAQANQLEKVIANGNIDAGMKAVLKNILQEIRAGQLTQGNIPAFATGGRISGPGSGTSDDILARVSNGEYVINAAATKANLPLLEAINGGNLPAFADGGFVGMMASAGMSIGEIMKAIYNKVIGDFSRRADLFGGDLPKYNTGGLVEMLKQNEGYELYPYVDTRGFASSGYGHKMTKAELVALGLSTSKGAYTTETLRSTLKARGLLGSFKAENHEAKFLANLEEAKKGARIAVPSYDQHPAEIQDVLVDMAYNLGQTKLTQFEKMITALGANDYSTAAMEMLDSNYAQQLPNRSGRNAAIVRSFAGKITGEGTGTSDSILARLSKGEFVVNAQATSLFEPLLKMINTGKLPKFNAGGTAGSSTSGARTGFGGILSGLDLSGFGNQEVLNTLRRLEQRLTDQSLTDVQRLRLEEEAQKLRERIKNELEEANAGSSTGAEKQKTVADTRFGELATEKLSSDLAFALSRSDFSDLGGIIRNGIVESFQKSSEEVLKENLNIIIDSVFSSINVPGGGGGNSFLSTAIGAGMSYFGFNKGGLVPHMPGVGDRVPAMLEPGELVVPKKNYNDVVGNGGGNGTQIVNINISGNVDQRSIDQIRKVIQASPEQVGSAQTMFEGNTRGLRRN